MESISISTLQELADKVQAAQRQVDAARTAVEDDKCIRSGSVLARIADFFIRTRPEQSLDDCEARLASLTYQGKNAARAWIIATAGQRLAEQSADAIRHRDQTQRLDHALNRAGQVNGWLALAEAAHGQLWAAHRACKSASTSELLDAMSSNKGIAALSYLDTSSAANAVTRARLAVEALVSALPKQAEPVEIQQPGDMLDLAVDLVFDPGFDVLSYFNMFRLDDSANKCALAAGTLQPLLNRLRNMSSDVAAKAEQQRNALRSIQTPYLQAAAGDVPDLLRVEIPADCVLRTCDYQNPAEEA